MAIQTQDVIGMIAQTVMKNPDILTSLMNHPYSTVAEVSGENKEDLSKEEVSQVVAGVSGLASGQQVDFGSLASLASTMLAQNNGSTHAMASSLLGETLTPAVQANPTSGAQSQPANALAVENIAKLLGAGAIPGVDLSDGFDFKDVIGLAMNFLGGKR